MERKKRKDIYLILLLLFVLPYDYSKLLLQTDSMIITGLTYLIRILLIFSVIYYMKNFELNEEKKSVLKKILLYFVFIFGLNIFSSIIFAQGTMNELVTRTFSMLYMYGFYVYVVYNYEHFDVFNSKLKYVCIFLLIFSIFLYIFYPLLGKSYEGYGSYAFLGMAANRNSYFELMLPAIVAILFLKKENKIKILDLIVILLIITTIVLTKSITSIIALIVFLFLIVIGKFVKNKSLIIKISLVLVVAIWILFFSLMISGTGISDFSLLFTNKSSTLSGRTMIWDKAFYFIKDNPILGYGYDNHLIGDTANYYMQASDTVFPNDSHNSIIFLLLSSGFLGAVVLVSIIIRTMKKGIYVVKQDDRYYYLLAFLIATLIRGLTESCFHYSHMFFFIYLIVISIKYNELVKKKEISN